jgi:CBS domain-containing protein
MATTVAEIMAREPETIRADRPVNEAAQRMRAADAGHVVVLDGDRLAGILTDRDIVVRVMAEGKDGPTPVRKACSGELSAVSPSTGIDQAAELMRKRAVRRLPVVEGDQVAGGVSIGDFPSTMTNAPLQRRPTQPVTGQRRRAHHEATTRRSRGAA